MRVSVKWLSEYLDLSSTTPKDLANEITLTGIEVDEVSEPFTNLKNIKVGKVLSAERMEGSDHLNITVVEVGEDEPYQIVCGAPNVQADQRVVVALPGARLANGLKIKKSKLRGHVSNGMICSLEELGFSDSVVPKKAENGIYILPQDAEIGEDALPYLGLDDSFIELDITPNRADALSMRGVAFEAGAILSQRPVFKNPELAENEKEAIADWISVQVDDEKDAPVYKMRIIQDLEVKESPSWLQKKLMNAGIRPIDAVVDVTNYMMLEYGQPMHAFDYDALGSKMIRVRRADKEEVMVTLDGQKRLLNTDNLVITNGTHPVALAGVMGGENTLVTKNTRTVALESAVFESSLIRKTAQSLNLRSESSSRFEKGLNLSTVEEALDHAASLIASLGNGSIVSGIADASSKKAEFKTVETTVSKINRSLGTMLTLDTIEQLIDRLGFEYEIDQETLKVSVPPRRWDIAIEADIIEEIARLYGYNQLPSTLPVGETIPGELTRVQQLSRFTRHFMEGTGLSQAISYALTTTEKAKMFALDSSKAVSLDWPMSEEHKTLRQSLVSGLLDNVQYNVARQNKHVGLYELGRVFTSHDDELLPRESNHLAGIVTGSSTESSWNVAEKAVDFYTVKGIVEAYLEQLGLACKVSYKPTQAFEGMHPGRTAEIRLNNNTIGMVGQLHPIEADERDLQLTVLFEMNLDELFDYVQDPVVFTAIPKYPGTSRDVALLVKETVLNEELVTVMEQAGGEWLKAIELFDLYQGESIKDGMKSVAYRLSYQNPNTTLKEEEVNDDFEKIKQVLIEKLNVEIR